MIERLKELRKASDLLWAWTGRIIRGRYQQTALGWLWAVVQPVATAAIFTVVFTHFVPVSTGGVPYIVFSFTALLPWTLLSMSLSDMSVSLVQNMNLVTKVYFPREILPIAAMMARMPDFAVSAILLAGMLIYYRLPVSPAGLLFLPVVLGIEVALILGLGIGSACLNAFYRDADPLLRLVLQIWFYASPVIYSINTVPTWMRGYYYLNPMAGVIEGYRDILLNGRLPGAYLLPAGVAAFLILVGGYLFFKRVEPQIADII
jgi:lipopolysaccharide transport system permease protein